MTAKVEPRPAWIHSWGILMKTALLLAVLLTALGNVRAQSPEPTPSPTPAAKPEAAAAEKPSGDPSALRAPVDLINTDNAESMEIPVAPDAPNPDKANVLTGKLPGDEEAPEPPPVSGTVEVAAKDNGKTVSAVVGNLVRITLESNPSTGYNWELRDFDYGAAIFHSSDLVARKTGNVLMGAPGDTVIVLQAIDPGTQQITAVYRRPWEPPDQVASTFSFTLEVDGKAAQTSPAP